MRLLAAARAVAAGSSLTEAAAAGDYASPSHLSDNARDLLGLTASDLLGTGVTLSVVE